MILHQLKRKDAFKNIGKTGKRQIPGFVMSREMNTKQTALYVGVCFLWRMGECLTSNSMLASGEQHTRYVRSQKTHQEVSQFFMTQTSPEIDSVCVYFCFYKMSVSLFTLTLTRCQYLYLPVQSPI